MKGMFRSVAVIPVLVMGGTAMAGEQAGTQAISMQVSDDGGEVNIALVAHSAVEQAVAYEIEIQGASRAVHKGRTTIPAHEERVLSRFKVNYTDDWCAHARIRENAGEAYTLNAGPCATPMAGD